MRRLAQQVPCGNMVGGGCSPPARVGPPGSACRRVGRARIRQGIQLWIALPEETRDREAAFEHHASLPEVELDGGAATLLIGSLGGHTSPARYDTPLVGIDLALESATSLALEQGFEHALVVFRGEVRVDGEAFWPGHLGYLGTGRDELTIEATGTVRAMLLGGAPFEEPIQMWWNFVGRARGEFIDAYRSWTEDDGRFGTVASRLPRIETTPPRPKGDEHLTEVFGGHEGQGLARVLVDEVLSDVRRRGLGVLPECPYARMSARSSPSTLRSISTWCQATHGPSSTCRCSPGGTAPGGQSSGGPSGRFWLRWPRAGFTTVGRATVNEGSPPGRRWGGRRGSTTPVRRWRRGPDHGAGGAVRRSARRYATSS